MPKNEQRLQKEVGLPVDSRVISRETEYLKFKMQPVVNKATERMMTAEGKEKFRVPYREENEIEANLGVKYVQVNAFDSKSSGNF